MAYRELKLKDRLSVYPMAHVECDPRAKFEITDGDSLPNCNEFKGMIAVATGNEEFSDDEYKQAYEFFKLRLDKVFLHSDRSRLEIAVEVVERK